MENSTSSWRQYWVIDPDTMAAPRFPGHLDPARWPPAWRDDWEIHEQACPMPQAWHRSGLCFLFEFEQLDEHGSWGWIVWDAEISASRLDEMRAELGDVFTTLWTLLCLQARTRWHELGYNDWSLRAPCAAP